MPPLLAYLQKRKSSSEMTRCTQIKINELFMFIDISKMIAANQDVQTTDVSKQHGTF